MKALSHILQFERKSLRRNNTLKILLLVTNKAGIYFGKWNSFTGN